MHSAITHIDRNAITLKEDGLCGDRQANLTRRTVDVLKAIKMIYTRDAEAERAAEPVRRMLKIVLEHLG